MTAVETISLSQARRLALAAQGFAARRTQAIPRARHFRQVVDRLGLLQIDSVNVLRRAHYLPVYSRIGGYDPALLDRAAERKPRYLFEYWAHEASYVPVRLQPALRWRMQAAHAKAWFGIRRIAQERPQLVDWVRAEVRDRGPATAAEIEGDVPKRSDNWGWNWSDVKAVLEWLFFCGEITAAGRTSSFARRYDLPDRVLPPEVLNAPTPSFEDAIRTLVEVAARALGVAAEMELRDYYRLSAADTKRAIDVLVEVGVLEPVQVSGWRGLAYRHSDAALPRQVTASALISPFDPLIWQRQRTQRLFDFHYRIEIYTPPHKRVHGYYVLPFLHRERMAARVDLKADRASGVLQVPAVWHEPGAPADTAEALAVELRRLAEWLGLSMVAAPARGDLAKGVKAALRGVA